MVRRVIIMGAAGRDFHNFNMLFRGDGESRVVAFTAAQIPFIEGRRYPPSLSGGLYPDGIPIYPEEMLPGLIEKERADTVVFSYSDVSHEYVMHRASIAVSLGADFVLLGAERTMLRSKRPVISVCAVRTGCGKSGVTRYIAAIVAGRGRTPVAIRHPMPYGDLEKMRVQRFASVRDMKEARCTIEEMEEYEPLIDSGVVVYAGVDYADILEAAEKEADVIIWDGGNNDLPFIRPGLELVVVDPLRPGHETTYHPGEANLRRAGCVIIGKANTAPRAAVEALRAVIEGINPSAKVVRTASVVRADGDVAGKRVLVIEDGPTLTHGGMGYGAGIVAARDAGASPVDPRPFAVGSVRDTLLKHPHLKDLLPAMGYSPGQVKDLEESINATPCDAVLVATPVNLSSLIEIKAPAVRVSYEIEEIESPGLKGVVEGFLDKAT
jgi:predicted GTPase